MIFHPHREVGKVIEARAQKLGVARGDYIEFLVAKALKMDEYGPTIKAPDTGQEALFPDMHP